MSATENDFRTQDLASQARNHLVQHFASAQSTYGTEEEPKDVLIAERGDGPFIFDTKGRRYIDSLSSLYCAQLGYSYGEEFAAAISAQMAKLPFHTNWGTAHSTSIELAGALAERAPGDLNHVFFTSGGSESVEAAWKIAREYFTAKGEPQRLKAIARKNAYHGVTLGALSFTGVPGYKEAFGAPAINVTHVSNTNSYRSTNGDDPQAFCAELLQEVRDAIAEAGADEVAMVIAEPVQNAGGCLTPPDGYWDGLREICDEHGILLVADSVICGFGRLGSWLGIEHQNVVPDMVTTAKGLTSAYAPMGAVFVADKVADGIADHNAVLRHGITFGGHPVSCAVALTNIEIFERDGILENVQALTPTLEAAMQSLLSIPLVGDVRGAGFFWAAEMIPGHDDSGEPGRFDKPQRDALLRGYLPQRLREAGLIARADDRGDSVIQIAPPLISDPELLEEIVSRLGEVLSDASEFMGLDRS